MTLEQISYMILEGIRAHNIVDDENIDIRLIDAWVQLKRIQYLRNVIKNPFERVSLINYQVYPITVGVVDITPVSEYPFDNTLDPNRQLMKIIKSTTTVPTIIESNSGPLVYSVETTDQMKFSFSFVDYDYLKVAGNGRFNSSLVFAAIRDSYLYLKYNAIFDGLSPIISLNLRAVFTDPTVIPGFDRSATEYPCSGEVIEYIKNGIYDKDLKVALTTKADTENNANGEVV